MRNIKTLIIHDRFMFRGGAERLVLDMAQGLDADILTGWWSDEESFSRDEAPGRVFELGKDSKIAGWRYIKFQILFFFKTRFIRDYELVIFSGNNCLAAAFNVPKNVPKIFYSHTPVRHAYDLRDWYLQKQPWWFRPVLALLIMGSRIVYQLEIRLMDVVVTNSVITKERFKRYLNMDVNVISPPIRTDRFKWIGQKDYYMTVGRVDKFKRIPDIVKAFQRMPDKKLIIPSGGDDFEKVREMAKGYDNIEVLGWVGGKELFELVGNCISTIYIPINEDAGMAQLEGMSAGKPCISVDEGGMKVSVIDGKTGIMIPAKYTIDDIIKAVERMTPSVAMSMKDDCIAMAEKFNYERFIDEIKDTIENVMASKS